MITYNAAKLDLLRSHAERLNAAAIGAGDRHGDARLNLGAAKTAMARLLRDSGSEVYEPRVVEAEALIVEHQAEFDRQKLSYEVATTTWQHAARLINSCLDFVERENAKPRPAGKRAASIVPARIVSDPRQPLKQLRERIAALKAECEIVQGAPIPREESIARIDAMLAHYARPPEIGGFVNPDRKLFEYDVLDEHLFDRSIVWLLHGHLRTKLVEMLDDHLNALGVPFGLPAAARAKRVADLEAEALAIEYDEEQLITAHEGGEILLLRRLEADPRAVLEVEDDEAPRASPLARSRIIDPPAPRKIRGAGAHDERGLLSSQWSAPLAGE